MPTSEELRSQIEALGEKVRDLKGSGGAAEEIKAAVDEMLRLKQAYADQNGGMGIDGKPYEPPLSKAEKKAREKKAKQEAAAAAAASGGGGGEKKEDGELSENAKKKAAKKAEAKAKKAAIKSGGDAEGGGAAKPAAAPAKAPPAAEAAAPKRKPPVAAGSSSSLKPLQMAWNPNATRLSDRPVVALTVAILTNTFLDLTLTSDPHRASPPGLGLSGGGEVVGDVAVARFLARRAIATAPKASGYTRTASLLLGRDSPEEEARLDQWMDYALQCSKLSRGLPALTATLNHALAHSTFLLPSSPAMTLADLCVFAAMGFPSSADALQTVLATVDKGTPARRWIQTMASHAAIQEATQLAMGVSHEEVVFDSAAPPLEPLVQGMNALQGATPGRVVTRFPPEPSGYLHVGHAKAVLLNSYYAQRYRGRLIVRFDDTNPSKEKEEYQESILQDLQRLGVNPDVVTFTSDYFATIRGLAEQLIRDGFAFMDDTPQEEMQKERMDRVESKHRNQTVEQALEKFSLMCSGNSEEGSAWCLRARIDMSSVNGTMRDPVLYRQNLTPHHRTGTSFFAYPTYDLACPIVDSLEGVTHALRTTEYNDRDEQYQWLQSHLGLRRSRIHAFSRINFQFTLLSKRKLAWFVDSGVVPGWNDARFPTIQGVIRRGVDMDALRQFIYSQGASRNVVSMEWNKFWAENKKFLDKRAGRYMAIDAHSHVALHIKGGGAPTAASYTFQTTDLHPKDTSLGQRLIRLADTVWLETVDAAPLEEGSEIVLLRWGVVRITKVIKKQGSDGEMESLEGEYVPDGDFKTPPKLSWIADVPENCPVTLTEFDYLVTKDKLDDEDNYQDYVNPVSMATSQVVGDALLKTLEEHAVIQLERRGYFRVDRPYMAPDKPLILYMIPEGNKKAMGGLVGKLAHR